MRARETVAMPRRVLVRDATLRYYLTHTDRHRDTKTDIERHSHMSQ